MNNILEKVKQHFSSNFGKLAVIITGLSFIITLLLSISFKNRVDVSILKAIISAILTLVILFVIGIILKKYLGDVIDESTMSSNSDIDYNVIDDNSGFSVDSNNNTNAAATSDDTPIFTPDLSNIENIGKGAPKPVNVDKNNKVDYHSSGDDIGDIVFGSSNTSSASNYTTKSTMFPDKKIDNEEMVKEAQEDPEKVAKAVRTMIAKDEKSDNK